MKICIDAGHGLGNRNAGYDPGAVGGGLEEADIALAWALTGKWVFERAGIDVFLTRSSDAESAPVGGRDDEARHAGCTHFVSIHCNAAGWTVRGTETIYRDARDKPWAELVQGAAVMAVRSSNRGVKQESSIIREGKPLRLSVLDFPGPACLLETAFISNGSDRVRLVSRAVRIAFWEGLARRLNA
jgi:N-acetylmuramoyl-L-alanine amidase